jgi:L-threonylcarbamoyladenylate synthase
MKLGLKTVMIPADGAAEPAARCLADGGLVAFPTETVYGLGADATNARAVARLYEAKGRPSFNPLIAHVSDLHAARQIAHFDDKSLRLAEAFWPGPLTLVLPKIAGCPVSDLATAGLETLPSEFRPIRRRGPFCTLSENPLWRHQPISPGMFRRQPQTMSRRPRRPHRFDCGWRAGGGRRRSTIVGCFNTSLLLRPGGLPREDIERVLGESWHASLKTPARRMPNRWRRACWPLTMHREPVSG